MTDEMIQTQTSDIADDIFKIIEEMREEFGKHWEESRGKLQFWSKIIATLKMQILAEKDPEEIRRTLEYATAGKESLLAELRLVLDSKSINILSKIFAAIIAAIMAGEKEKVINSP